MSDQQSGKLLLWAITCALAGFIFGFDLIVISGAEQRIQDLWGLSSGQHGWAMSSALWGTVLGALFGGLPTDRFGRKKTLVAIGVLYFVSALGSAFAGGLTSFFAARFLGGVGIGISTVAAPLFISEISPADRRGRLTGMFQFNIVLGLLIATLSNFAISSLMGEGHPDAWRWMLGIEAVPALIYSVMCLTLPESPRWLIGEGRRNEGREIFAQINPSFSGEAIEAEVQKVDDAAAESAGKGFSMKGLRTPILIAFLVAFFNQLSGINAILGFAPRIFQLTGIDTSASLLNSSLITLVNLIFTLVGLRLIDHLGRRTLLYVGSIGYIVSLGICAWAFHSYQEPFDRAAGAMTLKNEATEIFGDSSKAPKGLGPLVDRADSEEDLIALAGDEIASAREESGWGGTLVLLCILAFIAAHAVGQGAVIWVLISEIFPAGARAFGQSLGSATHWIFAALLTLIFPLAMEAFQPSIIFAFFSLMMVLQLIWVRAMVPETKGIGLEDMANRLGSRDS